VYGRNGAVVAPAAAAVPTSGGAPIAGFDASGFPVQNGVTFGGITIAGCVGVSGLAFDAAGNMFVSDYVTGDVYEVPPGGAIVDDANRITPTPLGISLGALTPFAPAFHIIDHVIYHTTLDVPELVPAVGLAYSERAFLKVFDEANRMTMAELKGVKLPNPLLQ